MSHNTKQSKWRSLFIPSRKSLPWMILRLPLLAFVFLLLLASCGVLDRAYFYPSKDPLLRPPAALGEVREEQFVSLDETRLTRWVLPAKEEQDLGKPSAMVLHVHGNAANLSNHMLAVHWLKLHQIEVHGFDYRGYGSSQGKVKTRKGPLKDTQAALREAKQYAKENQLPLFVLGQSIGGNLAAAALMLEGSEGVDGLILDCTFSSWQDIAADSVSRGLSWLVSDKYSAQDSLKELPEFLPILLLHGERDQIIDLDHYERLKAVVGERPYVQTWVAPKMGHIQAFSQDEATQEKFLLFTQQHMK